MKKLNLIASLLIFVLFLAGCNIPGDAEPTEDVVATQVARLLTEAATEAIQAPTETVAPPPTETEAVIEETSTPTSTATASPTPEPDDPAQQLGSPAWTYDFNGSSSPWDFDSDQATFNTNNGTLNMTAKANANWHSWYVSSPRLQNAYVEATIEMSTCSGQDRFGLAVRSSSDGQQFYFLTITCSGQWGFFLMEPDVNISQIIGYQPAAPLSDRPNSPHRVGIWMKGSSFTLYIDGEEVGTASDSTLTGDGYTGFLIAYANNPGFTVRVDELKYWNIP